MILKEFDLVAEPDDAPPREKLQVQTRCVTALYARCFSDLGTFRTDDIWKVLIKCVPVVRQSRVLNLLGVATKEVAWEDREAFHAASSDQKKRMALTLLWSGLASVVEDFRWSRKQFDAALQCVQANDLNNEYIWKSSTSPDKKHIAHVRWEHDVSEIRIYLEVVDRKSHGVLAQKVMAEWPHEFVFVKHFGRLKWTAPDRVSFVGKDGADRMQIQM